MRGIRHVALMSLLLTALMACGNDDDGFDWNEDLAAGNTNVGLGGDGSLGQGGGLVTRVDRECPPRDAEGVTYAEEDPLVCAQLDLRCTGGELPFRSICGCGCVVREAWCPDPGDPDVRQLGRTRAACIADPPVCLPGEDVYDDECGCGCIAGDGLVCPADAVFGQGTIDLADGERCDNVIACLPAEPDADELDAIYTAFPSMQCAADTHPDCSATQLWTCSGPLGNLTASDVLSICALARRASISRIGCSSLP